ncbi:MAG: MopE-related protein [Myxococcota bacterium]
MRHYWLPLSLIALTACNGEGVDTGDSPPGLLVDRDGDGIGEDEDCDDNNPGIYPGNNEVCNSIDDNCDGVVDEGVTTRFYPDQDEDGFGDVNRPFDLCSQQPGQVVIGGDCNDNDPTINPDTPEVCDNLDNNCDSVIDEGLRAFIYEDQDGDGYGRDGTGREGCLAPGFTVDGGDCDDDDPFLYPEAPDICGDGRINTCDATEADAIADCTGSLIGKSMTTDLALAYIGPAAGSQAGFSVDGVGDVNGDGTDDFIAGAPELGVMALIHGGTPEGVINGATLAGGVQSLAANSFAGYDVVGLGDMDSDGFDDFMIGAPLEGGGTTGEVVNSGRVYIVNGPLNNLLILDDGEGNTDADAVLLGEEIQSYAGAALDAGDINGDNIPDVLIGAFNDGSEAAGAGTAYIFYGKVPDGPDQRLERRADVQLYGTTLGAGIGIDVLTVDFNGDGLDDIVLSSSTITGNTGATYLFYGSLADGEYFIEEDADILMNGNAPNAQDGLSLVRVGDIDDDGNPDLGIGGTGGADNVGMLSVMTGSSAPPTVIPVESASIKVRGVRPVMNPAVRASELGDINNDGADDLLMSLPLSDINGADSGTAHVFFGPLEGNYTVNEADTTIYGRAGEQVGQLAEPGDYTGDGVADLLFGAPGYTGGTGAVFVLSLIGDGTY